MMSVFEMQPIMMTMIPKTTVGRNISLMTDVNNAVLAVLLIALLFATRFPIGVVSVVGVLRPSEFSEALSGFNCFTFASMFLNISITASIFAYLTCKVELQDNSYQIPMNGYHARKINEIGNVTLDLSLREIFFSKGPKLGFSQS